jgi:hypothetical protein
MKMMDWTEANSNLHFERRSRPLPYRVIAIGVGLGIFTLLWILIPPGILYWLLLPLLAVLVWAASYSWRQALTALIALLHRLEQF